jgi:GNAT superfamily N-acetyltransferase
VEPLTLTAIDLDDDSQVDAVQRLVSADEIAVVGVTEETAESIRSRLSHPDSHAPAHRLAWRDGQAIGALLVELDRHGRDVFLDAYAPAPDRVDVLIELLEDGLASARAIAADDPADGRDADGSPVRDPHRPTPGVWQAEAGSYGQDEGYATALAATGFAVVRRFWRMRRELSGLDSVEPAPPAGVTRRTVAGHADRRVLHALFSASFAEHYGTSHDRPYDEWIASLDAVPGVDPSRWWIASLDGVDVALCILDDSRESLGCGYVRTLGVLPDARGRGIARWLLGCAAADAVARGRSAITLTVDGENTTGATALYESVGYAIDEVIDVWHQCVVGTGGNDRGLPSDQ